MERDLFKYVFIRHFLCILAANHRKPSVPSGTFVLLRPLRFPLMGRCLHSAPVVRAASGRRPVFRVIWMTPRSFSPPARSVRARGGVQRCTCFASVAGRSVHWLKQTPACFPVRIFSCVGSLLGFAWSDSLLAIFGRVACARYFCRAAVFPQVRLFCLPVPVSFRLRAVSGWQPAVLLRRVPAAIFLAAATPERRWPRLSRRAGSADARSGPSTFSSPVPFSDFPGTSTRNLPS